MAGSSFEREERAERALKSLIGEERVVLKVTDEIISPEPQNEESTRVDIYLPDSGHAEGNIRNFVAGFLGLSETDPIIFHRLQPAAGSGYGNNLHIYYAAGALLLSFFILFLFFFLIPFRFLLRRLNWILDRSRFAGDVSHGNLPSFLSDSAGGGGAGALPQHGVREGKYFDFIGPGDIENLAYILRLEEPEKIAVIGHFLPEDLLAELLDYFPKEKQEEIVEYLTRKKETPEPMVLKIEEDLKKRLPLVVGGKDRIMKIMGVFPEEQQRKFMNTIAFEDPDLAREIEDDLHAFEGLADVPLPELRAFLKEVPFTQAARALQSASSELKDLILSLFSHQSRSWIEQEMNYGKVSKAVSIESQRYIMKLFRKYREKKSAPSS
ncbi:MAG TPA: FliG C-terminal domain-containing protein [bacterium]|nr:FliG C-terminal domain-containing protein [bacterium]